MSTFPVPNYLAENAARLEKMSKDFGATLPKDMAVAIGLMSHPAAGMAALTAIGFGFAGQAFGLWAGAVASAAEASQRLFAPDAGEPSAPAQAPATVTALARPKPALKVVAESEPAPKVVAKAEPAGDIVAKAEPAPKVVVKAEPAAEIVAKAEPAPKVVLKAEPAAEIVTKAEPALKVALKAKPAAKVVAKAGPAQRVVATAAPAKKPVAAPPVEAPPAATKGEAAELMPEDFHKPRAIERPAAPDDLKAISGIGPKLEKVLNDLGVWTYAQIAGWGTQEVAWVDDYLSFSGRIGRDKWIEQAAALAAAPAKPKKG